MGSLSLGLLIYLFPVVVFLTAMIGVVFSSKVVLATTSAGSTFSQLIREIDCSHTVYSKAVGQMNDVECDVFPPKYDHSMIKDNGYPVIYGVYDAVHRRQIGRASCRERV